LENRAIDRVTIGAVLVIPFIVTDFRALTPDMPVRLGALGALLVVTAILIAGSSAETQRQGIWLTLLRVVGAALLGAAAAWISPDVDAAQIVRSCAVVISGVLTIGLMIDGLRARLEAREPGVLDSIGASTAPTREDLIAELVRQPVFESARRYRERELGRLRSASAARSSGRPSRAASGRRALGAVADRSRRRARDVVVGSPGRHSPDHPVA
jgi:hypothetical protein